MTLDAPGGPRTPARRFHPAWLAVAALVLAIVLLPQILGRIAAARLESAARQRGLVAHWSRVDAALPARVTFRGITLVRAAAGDTLFRADSLGAALDPWSLALLRVRLASVGIAHASLRLPARASADADTLAPDTPSPKSAVDEARASRIRHAAESLVRALAAPARRMPRLALRDLTFAAPGGADEAGTRARLAWLDLQPTPRGVRLDGAGVLEGEQPIPFQVSASYARDDRLIGGARFRIPDRNPRRATELRVSFDGAVAQERRTGVVVLSDTSQVRIGELAFRLGARFERRGPRFQLALRGDGFTEQQVKRSLPPALLGPLLDVGVRGRWDYRLDFDLDFDRPDSVTFTADVVPHGLTLDPSRTTLRLLTLDEPFVAEIHLPHDRVVTRELSEANPAYHPLVDIAPALTYAVVTNEDGAFFRHRGFNTGAVREAIAENLRAGAFRRGAGTITMQLARNLYLGHERTLSRKFREVVLAWILEHLSGASKERLLEIYLNIIEWGPEVHGAGEAARFYFDRDPAALSVDEALFLATVVPAPRKWRYRFDAEGRLRPFVRAQMHFIGRAMIAKGWLGAEQLRGTDSLDVELRGAARAIAVPDTAIDHAAPLSPVPGFRVGRRRSRPAPRSSAGLNPRHRDR